MADPYLTSEQRAHAYRLLFQINRSFHLIVCRLSKADSLGIAHPRDIKDVVGCVQEVQMEINTAILDRFGHYEDRDLVHFGKVRTAMEKRLRE